MAGLRCFQQFSELVDDIGVRLVGKRLAVIEFDDVCS
jgi:hypothetical protein